MVDHPNVIERLHGVEQRLVRLENCSSVSAGLNARMGSTIRSGVVAGSNPTLRTRLGDPASPARIDIAQKLLVPTR